MDRLSPRSIGAVGLVISLHFLLYWVALSGLGTFHVPKAPSNITVDLLEPPVSRSEPPPPPLSWMFQAPEDIEVPEPVIVLSGDPTLPAGAIMGGPPQFVMPRPDPAHVNAGLLLPGELIKGASSPSVQLTIFVLQDGSVGEAKVERSCGEPEVDRLAMTHVEREWRFIPAYLGTQPVAHWMVVFVKFLG